MEAYIQNMSGDKKQSLYFYKELDSFTLWHFKHSTTFKETTTYIPYSSSICY